VQDTIPYAQFIGGLVDAGILVLFGVWFLYIWPRSIRKRMDSGALDEEDAHAHVKKAALFGYAFILFAIASLVGTLAQIGFFGYSVVAPIAFLLLAVGASIWWFREKRKLNL
jgi:hypothetical protein